MEFGRFSGGPDLFMRLFVNKTMVLVDQLINHIHVPPQVWFFRVSCSWFHLHHSDIMVKRHSSTSEQIEWASTTVQEWHRSRLEFTELNSELVCVEHLTVETLEQKMRFAATESLLELRLYQAIKQLTFFNSHSCIRHEVCANHVGRLYDVRAWVLMGSRSAITLEMWKSTWRCGNVRSQSFPLLPYSTICDLENQSCNNSFTRLAWWLWDHHAKCLWCWSGAWWSHQPSSNKGNGVDHPMDSHGYMVCFFFPPGNFPCLFRRVFVCFCMEKPQHSWVDMKHMAFHLDRMKDDEAGLSNTIQLK